MPLSGSAARCSRTRVTASATAAPPDRHVDPGGVQADREDVGEPADRAGQVGPGHQVLLAAVALQRDEHRVAFVARAARHRGDGDAEGAEQDVVDARRRAPPAPR